MHKFLSAIGFSNIRKEDLKIILADIIDEPDIMKVCKDSTGEELIEYIKFYSPDLGIVVRGYYDNEDEFQMEYYAPYFEGHTQTTREVMDIEKHADKESYAGVGDDPNLGLTLIFFVNDVADYLNFKPKNSDSVRGVALTALASEGKVLLPTMKKENKIKVGDQQKTREELIAEAREGDEEAAHILGKQEMDMYSIISKRVMKEDIMTIVTTYFMPYGVESDHYGILSEIQNVVETVNELSGEHVYILDVICNNLKFKVAIAKDKLDGIPAIGRRFKGNIWMQGMVADTLK